jgi:phospholipid-binding lipoprotein MlaA
MQTVERTSNAPLSQAGPQVGVEQAGIAQAAIVGCGKRHLFSANRAGFVAVLAILALGGCAAVPPDDDPDSLAAYNEANDPAEPLNRGIFEVNMTIDTYAIKPVATVYRDYVPDPVRDGIENFLDNLKAPVTFLNDVLQLNPERAGITFGRFVANSILGVGGIFDVVGNPAAPEHTEDFGQTLGYWGVSDGPYVMLPLLGPSSVRDGIGLGVDTVSDPFNFLISSTPISFGRTFIRGIDTRSRNITVLEEIERTSIDYYAAIRSLYRQRREDEIRNGEPGPAMVPEIASIAPEQQQDGDSQSTFAINQ